MTPSSGLRKSSRISDQTQILICNDQGEQSQAQANIIEEPPQCPFHNLNCTHANPCGRKTKPELDMNPFAGLRDDGTDPWTGKHSDDYNVDSDDSSNNNKTKDISAEEQIMRDNKHINEHLVENLAIQHTANHCSVFPAGHRMICEIDIEISKATVQHVTKSEELQPHQFAQVFRAAETTNLDIPSHVQAMCDHND